MNEDNRGVKRGACRVEDSDCGQFASNQINKNDYSCQYCGCPPSKHESLMNKKQLTKSTIRTSVKDGLDLRQKAEGGTSPVSATVETNTSSDPPKLCNEEKSRDADVDSRSTKLLKTRPWENSRLGWITNPQRPTGKFYNSIMPDFYRSFRPFYPDEKTFRSSFITERKRQWDMLQNIETLIKSKIRNLQNVSNQASAAKYIKEDHIRRKNDSNYIEELLKQVKEITCS